MTEIIVAITGGILVIINTLVLSSQHKNDRAREDGQERMALMLECLEACLAGLKELKANGPVTLAQKKLKEYKNKKSAV